MQEHMGLDKSPWIDMEPDDWLPLTAERTPIIFRKRSFVYHQTDPSQAVFIIKSGRLRITSYQVDGAEKQLYIAERGSMVGETSCITGKPYDTSAIAIVDTQVWRISTEELLQAMEHNWELNKRVLALICRKKNVYFQQILDLSFSQSIQRIAQLLLNLCQQYGKPNSNGTCINILFTHQDVTSMVNVSRVTVSNVFNAFMDQGVLAKEGKYFVITNLEELRTMASGET